MNTPSTLRLLYRSRSAHLLTLFRSLSTSSSSSSSPSPRNAHPKTIFSGIQPTGIPHLGNYLGAIKNWTHLQNTLPPSTTLIFSIVDLHAITSPHTPSILRQQITETANILLAAGLHPEKCNIILQSRMKHHANLMWVLSTLTPVNLLERQTQWKDKIQRAAEASKENPEGSLLKLGLFSYPVLQAADILLYRATHVPVGEDQAQHLELARGLAGKFNRMYCVKGTGKGKLGEKGGFFPEPETILAPTRRVMSLRNPERKMSKSDVVASSRISLTDGDEEIRKKIGSAVTDSLGNVVGEFDRERRPGVANLLEIWGNITGGDVKEFEGSTLKALKEEVTRAIQEELGPIRDRYEALSKVGVDWELLEGRARRMEEETWENVKKIVGFT